MTLIPRPVVPPLHQLATVFVLFYLGALLCIALGQQAAATIVVPWLHNGLVLAYLLRLPAAHWPVHLAATWLAGDLAALTLHGSVPIDLLHGLPDTLEILVGLLLLGGYPATLARSVAAMSRLLWRGVLVPPLLGTLLGVGIAGLEGQSDLRVLAVHRYIGDALGLLVALPLATLNWPLRTTLFTRHGAGEFLAMLLLSPPLIMLILSYLPFPFIYVSVVLLLLTRRLTVPGTAVIGGLNILLLALLLAYDHVLPLAGSSLLKQALTYIPVALMQIPPLLLAAASAQSRHQHQQPARSAARFRHTLYSAPYGTALLSVEGQLSHVNPALAKLLGEEPQALEGRSLAELLVGPALDGQALEGEHITQLRHRDGHALWVSLALSPDHDDEDLLSGYLLHVRDIDGQRRADETNARLNERLQLAVRACNLGIWEWDTRKPGFNADDRLRDLYGIDRDNHNGDMAFWLTFIHPDDRARALEVFDEVITRSMSYTFDFRIHRGGPGGEVRHIRSELISVVDADGHVRLVGSNSDVTEHHHLTTALYEEKERLQVTLASIADAVLTTDIDGRVLFLNPVAEQLTGWSLADAQGRPHGEVFLIRDGQTDAVLPSPVSRCLAEQTVTSLDEGAILVSRQGERHEVQDSAAPVRTLDGKVIGAVLVFQNVTLARSLQRELSYNASHDTLTGLYNRLRFEQALLEAWQQAQAGPVRHALCFIDLDRFKVVNDSAGHAAGDLLLRELGDFLHSSLRATDIIARVGGDEFALLLRDCELTRAEAIVQKLIAGIAEVRFHWQGRTYDVGASAGIVAITADTASPAELMSQADVACYTAKHAGRNRAALYRAGSEEVERQHREILMASGLREALEQNRFELHAQPIVATRPRPDGGRRVELLLRLRDVQGTLISPATFIPAAERFGMMSAIDRWVVRQVLVEQVAWFLARPQLKVSVNLSGNSLSDPTFLPELLQLIAASPLDPRRLLFELTETAVINSLSVASQLISQVRERGCLIALDDFGAGLSSFAYLKNFRVDVVKIDGSFVRQLDQNAFDRTIVESINQVAHRLGARTVAEFVESQASFELLKEIGVDYAQGYTLGKPVPLDELDALLASLAPHP